MTLKSSQRIAADGTLFEFIGFMASPALRNTLVEMARAERRSVSNLILGFLQDSFGKPAPKRRTSGRIPVQLPSGAVVHVSRDIKPQTLEALDELVRAAIKTIDTASQK
jgi:hypothetical protein